MFKSLFIAMLPMIEPAILNEWVGTIMPALEADVAAISNAEEKAIAQAALAALDAAAQVAIKAL